MMIEIDELEYKSLKLDKEGLLSLLDYKEQKIETLKSKLENIESIQRGKCCECESIAIQELSDMHFKTMPFEDDYFNGLTYKDIAELAKKSIRLTTENRRLEDEIEKLKGECEQSKYDYQKQLKNTNKWIAECEDLQKQLQTKEQECEELKIQVCRCSEGWGKAECEKNLYQQIEQEKQERNFNLKMQVSKYEQALDEIERHFDKRCDICREENGIEAICDVCWKKDIKGIINKAKEN